MGSGGHMLFSLSKQRRHQRREEGKEVAGGKEREKEENYSFLLDRKALT